MTAEILNINSGNTFTTGFQTQSHHGQRGIPKIILYPELLGFLLGTGKHKSRAKRYTFGGRARIVKHLYLHRMGLEKHEGLHTSLSSDYERRRKESAARRKKSGKRANK